jgi:glycosyltransferase involved in cell wall biosynthesis
MNRELISDGVNGFLPRDAAAWLAVLDALLKDASLARRIGAEGRITVEHDYALSVVSPRVAGLVAEAASLRVSA